jgi:hypothetical protein
LRLGDSYVGAYARILADGDADVRTVRRGELLRYLVTEEGTARLIESHPRTWRYPLGRGLLVLGAILAIGMVAVIVLVKFLRDSSSDAGLGWAAALCGIGLVAAFIGETLLHSQVTRLRPTDESWERVGGAEF